MDLGVFHLLASSSSLFLVTVDFDQALWSQWWVTTYSSYMKTPTKDINPRPTQAQTVLLNNTYYPVFRQSGHLSSLSSWVSGFLLSKVGRTLRNAVRSDDEQASQEAQWVRNSPATPGDASSIPGSGRSPGGGHSNSLQYSCLENPIDRGGWWATVHGVAKSQAQLK